MKKFWKKTEGFTLVELVVVIAILGILAGVGTVGYSGYVKKANRAADEALLNSLNTAFAAACIENGVDVHTLNSAVATLKDVSGGKALDTISPYQIEFVKYYEGGTFKVFTALAFDPNASMFIEGTVVQFGEYILNVSKELADAMKNNTFADKLGAEVLTGRVDTVSDIAAKILGVGYDDHGNPNTFTKLVFDEEGAYLNNLAKSLNMTTEELGTYLESGECDPMSFLANSLVLTAAQKTQGMDTSFLGTVGSADKLRGELEQEETATDAMAKLALTYGMYTSYMKSQGLTDASQELLDDETFTGMTGVLGTIEGTQKPEGATMSFNEYLASSQGQADLNAYLASMQVINDSANQSDAAAKDILANGFTNPDLVATINGLFGKAASN